LKDWIRCTPVLHQISASRSCRSNQNGKRHINKRGRCEDGIAKKIVKTNNKRLDMIMLLKTLFVLLAFFLHYRHDIIWKKIKLREESFSIIMIRQ
jgi:hypothetical protein